METITHTKRRWWLRIPTNFEAATTRSAASTTPTRASCRIKMSELLSLRRRSCHLRESMVNLGKRPKRTSWWHITRRVVRSHQRPMNDIKSWARSIIKITTQTLTRKPTFKIYRQSINQTISILASRVNHKFSTPLVTPTTPAAPPTRRIWSISKTRGCSSTKIQRSAPARLEAPQTTKESVQASATRPPGSW